MTKKRTFSLPDELSDQLDAVAPENASAFVAEAVRSRIAHQAAAARLRAAYGDPDPAALAYWMAKLAPAGSDQRAS